MGDYFLKIPKSRVTPENVEPKTYRSLNWWSYAPAVRKKLRFNEVPGTEPYEYAGYLKTNRGYTPVFRQNKLTTMGIMDEKGRIFNREAYSDIERQMENHPGPWKMWYDVQDYDLGHNIGKNAAGEGKLFDANLVDKTHLARPTKFFTERFTYDKTGPLLPIVSDVMTRAQDT